jgi:hypothetical protein
MPRTKNTCGHSCVLCCGLHLLNTRILCNLQPTTAEGRRCHRRVVLQNDPQIPLCMNCKYGQYGPPVLSSRFMLNCACDHSSTLIGFNTWPENYRFNTFHAFLCYSHITCSAGYLVFREHHTLCTEICDLISSSSSVLVASERDFFWVS